MGCYQVKLKKDLYSNSKRIEQLKVQQDIIQTHIEILKNTNTPQLQIMEQNPLYIIKDQQVNIDSILVAHDNFTQRINKMEEKLRDLFQQFNSEIPEELQKPQESKLDEGQIQDTKEQEKKSSDFVPLRLLKFKKKQTLVNPYFTEKDWKERKF